MGPVFHGTVPSISSTEAHVQDLLSERRLSGITGSSQEAITVLFQEETIVLTMDAMSSIIIVCGLSMQK